MATTTAKKTAKKTARKKTTTTTAKRSATKAAPKKTVLTAREPKVVLEDAGYAAAGLAHDVVELARALPTRLESVRAEDLRDRVAKDVEGLLGQLTSLLDKKAAEGRKVAADVRSDARVKRILDQTGNTRSQVKAAVTSVRKTADVSVVAGRTAGRKQAGNATSQVKAAVTSLRRSGATVADAAVETLQD
ncbi:hypothetical protein [Egicoccus sp. AB-alg6-2]|uniref:hypothetical protein n=1 Tax=Egicoccus sp. AB-alg6-2 TaxID=3242692 RepID=UPI00359D1BA3